jgi:uncharacterized protein YaiE (UPF0345 family)
MSSHHGDGFASSSRTTRGTGIQSRGRWTRQYAMRPSKAEAMTPVTYRSRAVLTNAVRWQQANDGPLQSPDTSFEQ